MIHMKCQDLFSLKNLSGHSVISIKCNDGMTILIELGFNDTSTLVGHFVSSPRERMKRDRRDSRRDEREE